MTHTIEERYASAADVATFGTYRLPTVVDDQRPLLRFRGRITVNGSSGFEPAADRYHLYVAAPCPYAQRSLITRDLAGLADVVGASWVDPARDGRGWAFRPPTGPDPVNGFALLREAYDATEANFDGHVSVPTLWDRDSSQVVSNHYPSIEIDLATRFTSVREPLVDLYPPVLRDEIDELDSWLDPIFRNASLEAAVPGGSSGARPSARRIALLDALDALDIDLQDRRYLLGSHLTLADVRLYCALVRFDTRTNVDRSIAPSLDEYDDLWAYVRELHSFQAFRSTTDFSSFAAPGADVSGWAQPSSARALLDTPSR